jgi:hypothetical protein
MVEQRDTKRVQLTGEPWGVYTLLLDGRDITRSVKGMTIEIPDGGQPAEITLRLVVHALEADIYASDITVEESSMQELYQQAAETPT